MVDLSFSPPEVAKFQPVPLPPVDAFLSDKNYGDQIYYV